MIHLVTAEHVSAAELAAVNRVMEPGDTVRVRTTSTTNADLRRIFADEGLVLVRPWYGEGPDLCLEATKPFVSELRVSAAMSVPRLGFMDNFGCALDALVPLGIKLRRQGGAFWGQALQNCLERTLDEDQPDAILTIDYDSVFTIGNVAYLLQLMMCHPEVDALAALQSSRHLPTALFTKKDENGEPLGALNITQFQPDLLEVDSAHFGLTLLRADVLAGMAKPWFLHVPSPDGTWGHESGKIDEDINFWVKWREAGKTLFLANRVVCGHMEVMVLWPGQDMQAIWQPVRDFAAAGGPPEGVWR